MTWIRSTFGEMEYVKEVEALDHQWVTKTGYYKDFADRSQEEAEAINLKI